MSFTGRRNTGLAGRIGKGLVEGLAAVGTAMADEPRLARIKEIDAEMERLQHEKDSLIVMLIEPGDLKVSDGYDRNKAVILNPPRRVVAGEGRLTQCKGRWSASSSIHDCHPGCPYIDTKHNPHEFTLRD